MEQPVQQTDSYYIPSWFIRWLVPVLILGFGGYLSHLALANNDITRRLTILETRSPEIERRLDRIERQNDDIKTMLQLMLDKHRKLDVSK